MLLAAACSSAQPPQSTTPTPRIVEFDWMSIADWYRRHADDVEAAAKGEGKIVFAGDSITEGWQWSPAYQRDFADLESVNIGIGGDKTENLLWRLRHGAVGKLDPQIVVLLIGVNNFGHNNDTPEAVFAGVQANVAELKKAFPRAKILALGVLPYQETADHPNRAAVKQVNLLIRSLEDERVTVLDIGPAFLEPDGSISKGTMGDFLHPTHAGYERLNAAILPTLQPWIDALL